MILTLPYPPSLNRMYRAISGRSILSKPGREYYERAVWDIKAQLPRGWRPITARVRVTVKATPPDRRRRDLDNLWKPILDALTKAGVWGDDSQVIDERIYWTAPQKDGRVVAEIEEEK